MYSFIHLLFVLIQEKFFIYTVSQRAEERLSKLTDNKIHFIHFTALVFWTFYCLTSCPQITDASSKQSKNIIDSCTRCFNCSSVQYKKIKACFYTYICKCYLKYLQLFSWGFLMCLVYRIILPSCWWTKLFSHKYCVKFWFVRKIFV